MYRSQRCLQSCLRALLATRRTPTTRSTISATTRYYGQAAESRSTVDSESDVPRREPGQRYKEEEYEERRERPSSGEDLSGLGSPKTASVQEASEKMADHLNTLFKPLKFPPDLAHRMLTHPSHASAKYGSNAVFTFTGRRVMDCYLNLFLANSKELDPNLDLIQTLERTMDPSLLGKQLGTRWGLNKVMQWTPPVTRKEIEQAADPEAIIRRIGLYKVLGDGVAATLGGICFQHGGSVAHRVFHTRILPHLAVKGGLPSQFNAEVQAASKRMGGPEGNLLHALGKKDFDDTPKTPSS